MTKTIITVATTGAWPKKENNPNVPMTPAEIAEDVYACWKAGAAVAHLHMRDDNGNGTMSADKFRETVELLLKVNGLTFQANWGGRPDPEGMLDRLQRVFPTPPGWQPDVLPEAGLRRFWDDGSLE